MTQPPEQTEYVYLIGSEASTLVKIGRTIDVPGRLAAIQRMSPAKLAVLWQAEGGAELETTLHRWFKDRRSHGEWFDFPGRDAREQVMRAIAETAAEAQRQRARRLAAKRARKARGVWRMPARRRPRKIYPSSRIAEQRAIATLEGSQAFDALDRRMTREIAWIREEPTERVKRTTELLAEIGEFSAKLAEIRRQSIARLRASGMTQAEVADAIGMKRGRVAQITKEESS